jgi:competence protein ComEC
MEKSKKIDNEGLFLLVLALAGVSFLIFYFDRPNKNLIFAMLDVGQGDAIFIESSAGTQILIDGGDSKKILGHLARFMPFFDRSLDAIIITNPDRDHIGGFLEVLDVYQVGKVFEPGTFNNSKTYKKLKDKIKEQNIPIILAKKGMRLNIGKEEHIDILFPDRDVSNWDPNQGSIIAKLIDQKVSVLLMGDATIKTEKIILENVAPPEAVTHRSYLNNTILKVGHHGSRTSSSEEFIQAVVPTYALISSGRNNRYDHPHLETLNTLKKFGVNILRTDLLGSIIMESNGQIPSFYFFK